MKEEALSFEGFVTEALPESRFRVKLENGHEILAYGSGKMMVRRIRIAIGDRVTVDVSPYDMTRGRITFRHQTAQQAGRPGVRRPQRRR